jgi:hypothetical protein
VDPEVGEALEEVLGDLDGGLPLDLLARLLVMELVGSWLVEAKKVSSRTWRRC